MILQSKQFNKLIKKAAAIHDGVEKHRAIIAIPPPIDIIVPEMPEIFNKSFRYGKTIVFNPAEVDCNCPEYALYAQNYSRRDINRLCKHLYRFYSSHAISSIPPMLVELMKENAFFGRHAFFHFPVDSMEFIIAYREDSEWLKFFAYGNSSATYSYNAFTGRWSYDIKPPADVIILKKLKDYFVFGA